MPTREGPQVSRGPVLAISATAAALKPSWGGLYVRAHWKEGDLPSEQSS